MSETEELPEDLGYDEWADALREGDLLGQECPGCGHVTGAPKAACARCGERDLSTVRLPTEGEVYTETSIYVPPAGFDGDYQVALVQLGEARVLARIDGHAEIGEAVSMTDVDEVEGHPAPVFAPD